MQIIQTTVTNTPQEVYLYLSSHNTPYQFIRRIRNVDLPAEPQSLEDLIILENFKKTLDSSDFLIKDSTISNNRILLFTTVANVRHLKESFFWIMDGTFKIVSTIFRQLYTIHECVGGNENSQIMPFVYALMLSKSEEYYRKLFQNLIDFSDEQNVDL